MPSVTDVTYGGLNDLEETSDLERPNRNVPAKRTKLITRKEKRTARDETESLWSVPSKFANMLNYSKLGNLNKANVECAEISCDIVGQTINVLLTAYI